MQWDMALQGLDDWMKAQNTHPGIRHDIIEGLSKWQEGKDCSANLLTTAAQEQTLLGWELMMEGAISKQWGEHRLSTGRYTKQGNPANGGQPQLFRSFFKWRGTCGIIGTRHYTTPRQTEEI